MASDSPFWPLALGAGIFVIIGAAIIAWPHQLIRRYVGLVKPMRRVFGRNLIDWEVGLLEGRAAPILVRLFGLFVIFAGASIFAFRLTR